MVRGEGGNLANRGLLRGIVAACCLALLIPAGCAEKGGDDGGRFFGVIAGVSRYRVSSFNLDYADDDAVLFFQRLLAGENWSSGDMVVLLNEAATRASIREAIFSAAARMGDDDNFVFFFSGHGTFGQDQAPLDEADGLDEYLVPHDALPAGFGNDIRDDELEAWLGTIPGGKVAVVVDASYSGGMFKGRDRVKLLPRPTPVRPGLAAGGDGITRDLKRPGYVVITASDDRESPIETDILGHGVFTYYLCEGLAGPADPGGRISVEEAYGYAAPRSTAFYAGMHPQMADLFPGDYLLVNLP